MWLSFIKIVSCACFHLCQWQKGIANLFCFNLRSRSRRDFGLYVTLYFLYINFFARLSRKYLPAVLPKVSTQTRQVDEDFTSFISFSSCDVTWRLNFIPSFSFHFIKTSREREASCKLVKKRCCGGGYRRVIIVVYVKKSVGNTIRCVIPFNLRSIARRIDLGYVTNEAIKIRINNLNTMLMQW